MLRIRLQRIGRKKTPIYRLIVSERSKDPFAGGIEILGQYQPTAIPKVIKLNAERITHWISNGAQPSNTVHNLLVKEGIITEKKQKSVKISKKRQAKIDEQKSAEEEKKQADKEAAKKQAEEDAEKKKQAEAAEKEAAAEAKEEVVEEKEDTTEKEDTKKEVEEKEKEDTTKEEAESTDKK